MSNLNIGDKAPDFEAKDQDGNTITLKQFRGKKVVLYFYPKDNTPGCTAEACNLRDNYDDFLEQGYEVIGISADSEKSHRNFISKYNLPFHLISDPGREVIHKYDAWGKKSLYGKLFDGIFRKTFVISEDGLIKNIIEKVKTKDHARQIFEPFSH